MFNCAGYKYRYLLVLFTGLYLQCAVATFDGLLSQSKDTCHHGNEANDNGWLFGPVSYPSK